MNDEDELPQGIIRSAPKRPTVEHQSPHQRTTQQPDYPITQLPNSHSPSPSRSRISALEPQERNKDRINVYVDGRFVMGVFADVVVTLGLKVGQPVTPERLEELARAETRRKAKEDAYRLLSFRARAEKEIADRLRQKGYEDDVITETLDSLRGLGFVNDEQFASSWVTSRGKTRGKQALAFELRQKGVDKETTREVLEERSGSEEISAARTAAVKRVGERPMDTSREAKARLSAYLGRRGFGWEIIRVVMADLYGRDAAEEMGEYDE